MSEDWRAWFESGDRNRIMDEESRYLAFKARMREELWLEEIERAHVQLKKDFGSQE